MVIEADNAELFWTRVTLGVGPMFDLAQSSTELFTGPTDTLPHDHPFDASCQPLCYFAFGSHLVRIRFPFGSHFALGSRVI
jgi:hypothetical protein